MNETIDKTKVGIYEKFTVKRTDGKDQWGEKHEHCQYFVLDVSHDPFALPALETYASACKEQYPMLAQDILAMITAHKLIALLTQIRNFDEETAIPTIRDLTREIEGIGRELMIAGGTEAHRKVFKLVHEWSEEDQEYLLASIWDFLDYEC